MIISVPQTVQQLGGLDSEHCKEILDEVEGEGVLEGPNLGSLDEISKQEAEMEKEPEEVIDPDDPLYGLEERLKYAKLDDDTKQVIKAKLLEAQEKIKAQLEERQANLDQKLAAGGKKK